MNEERPCPLCDVVDGRLEPIGGLLVKTRTVIAHAVLGGSPLAGWVVVVPRRHVEHPADLTGQERSELFELASRLAEAQREELGAEKTYLAIFSELVPHLHLHVVPRYPDTPERLRGPRAFQAEPGDELPDDEISSAVTRLAEGLPAR